MALWGRSRPGERGEEAPPGGRVAEAERSGVAAEAEKESPADLPSLARELVVAADSPPPPPPAQPGVRPVAREPMPAPSVPQKPPPAPEPLPTGRPTAASAGPPPAITRTPTSRLGEHLSVEGKLVAEEDLVIAGAVKGRLELSGDLRIEATGRLEADVVADRVWVSGEVRGAVVARERVELLTQGVLLGDVESPRIVIAPGARCDGRLRTGRSEVRAVEPPAEPERPRRKGVAATTPPAPSSAAVALGGAAAEAGGEGGAAGEGRPDRTEAHGGNAAPIGGPASTRAGGHRGAVAKKSDVAPAGSG